MDTEDKNQSASLAPAFPHNNVPVFFSCDNAFLPHTMVTIASLVKHASADKNYDLIILERGVSEERKRLARVWVTRPNISLRFLDMRPLLERIDVNRFHTTDTFSIEVYYRLFAQSIFPNYPRMIYLDSDVILFRDIAGLLDVELGEELVGACHDISMEVASLVNRHYGDYWRWKLSFTPGEDYFNSGVLLMNLAAMRNEDFERLCLEKIATLERPISPDQDILNMVCRGRVRFLDQSWNFMEWMADPSEESLRFAELPEEKRELCRARRHDFGILHYVDVKPWDLFYLGNVGDYYWRYAQQSPFFWETRDYLDALCNQANLRIKYIEAHFQYWKCVIVGAVSPPAKKARYTMRKHQYKLRKKCLLRHLKRMAAAPGKNNS